MGYVLLAALIPDAKIDDSLILPDAVNKRWLKASQSRIRGTSL